MAKTTPSLRDVARSAGVSLGTASRALNNKSNVLPTTRALVLKAAADLGYKLQIRVPTTISAIKSIGVVIKRDPGEIPSLDPFNYRVLCGIEDECERLGVNMMYASLPVDEYSRALSWPSLLEKGDVDGLILIGIVFSDPEIANHIPTHIPVVLADSYTPHAHYDRVVTNNICGTYEGVKYLIEQGHRCIGLIGSDPKQQEHPSIRERRQGYLNALADHQISQTYIANSRLKGESAYDATIRLLKQSPEVTAIFACNDDIAHYIINAIHDLNLRVPQDISVMGFDDIVAAHAKLALTTIQVDKELMGSLAVRQIYERAANPDRPPITTLIGTRLVLRNTVQTVVNRRDMPDTQMSN